MADKPIITYDFKHPRRVSKDQTRTLENMHWHLARFIASAFSEFQHAVVDCEIAYVDQTTYAEFIMSLANPSVSYTFTIEPLGGPAIIDIAPSVAFAFVDREFGGVGKTDGRESRPPTYVERHVLGRVITRVLADLEATWKPLLKVQVSDAELETNPEFMQIARPSDTVMLIAFEVNMQNVSGLVSLCYPYFTLEPVMSYLSVTTWAGRDGRGGGGGERQQRLDQLKGIESNIRVLWGQTKVSVADLAKLGLQDVLVLDTKTQDPGVVFVEDQPVFLARPGESEQGRSAVEVLRAIPHGDAWRYV